MIMPNGPFQFIGRRDALDAFHSLLSARAQKNALYIQADGGLGKTRLLQEYIKDCLGRSRWHVYPLDKDIEPIIDFFSIQNRTVSGLRNSIIDRLGEEYFAEFRDSEAKLRLAEVRLGATEQGSASNTAVFALRRRTDELFFKNFKRSLRGRQVVLFFDTFEVAYRRRVGRWFINTFLPKSEASLVVFAGRPTAKAIRLTDPSPRPILPPNVQFFELNPWTEAETLEYCRVRGIEDEEARRLHSVTSGRPLFMDLVIYFRNAGIVSADELNITPKEKLEWALIDRLVRWQTSEHRVIQEMAYLKRRFTPAIFAVRQSETAYGNVADYATLRDLLLKSELQSIVKYRKQGEIMTLHDEVQRMIEDHAYRRDWDFVGPRPDWEDMCSELYEKIIQGWYQQGIHEALTEEEQGLLIAEQLGYVLERDLEEGLASYRQYFDQVKAKQLFSLNELIWSEASDYLAQIPERALEIYLEQADWLFKSNYFIESADLYQEILQRFPDISNDQRSLVFVRLGHSYLRSGKVGTAREVFSDGREQARSIKDRIGQGLFEFNLGHTYVVRGEWDRALEGILSIIGGGLKSSRAFVASEGHGKTTAREVTPNY